MQSLFIEKRLKITAQCRTPTNVVAVPKQANKLPRPHKKWRHGKEERGRSRKRERVKTCNNTLLNQGRILTLQSCLLNKIKQHFPDDYD